MKHAFKTKPAYRGMTLAAPLAGLFLLTACGGSTSPKPTPARGSLSQQLNADINGGLNTGLNAGLNTGLADIENIISTADYYTSVSSDTSTSGDTTITSVSTTVVQVEQTEPTATPEPTTISTLAGDGTLISFGEPTTSESQVTSTPEPTEFVIPATPACEGDLCVNGKDWSTAFNGNLAFEPDPAVPGSQFLQIGENGLDYGVFDGNDSVIQNTGLLRVEDLGGNGVGEATFFRGLKLPNTYQYFAAILPDTDLGATLPYPTADEALVTAQWPGKFQVFQQFGLYSVQDFNLTVNFAERTLGLFVPAPIGDDYFFRFSGAFDSNGFFAGGSLYSRYIDGNPSLPFYDTYRTTGYTAGLIGVNGAVGVFASTEHSVRPYSGAFIAAPSTPTPVSIPCDTCVTAETWEDSFTDPLAFTPESANPRNEFLRMDENGLSDGMAGVTIVGDTGTLSLGDMTTDGGGSVSFFRGSHNPDDYQYYAAISSDVNVGDPLTRPVDGAATSAIWPGQFQYYRHNRLGNIKDFDLSVDFAQQTIGAFVPHLVPFFAHYKLDGTFDDNGVISGTVVYGTYADKDPGQIHSDPYYTPGILTGVIGVNGAVGAFIGNNDAIGERPFAGGFVAAPE